ncbi:hypothetical protein LCGC14_2270090 [marine sediment metagenome]|uniref:Uncharacterized protein n=1 Tax=marine sediment metagenome TaxID=412755 RepID=A0A0F9F9M4_9ZZZZ
MGKRDRLRIEAIRRGGIAPIAPKREPKPVRERFFPLQTLQTLGLLGPGPVRRRKGA